MSICFRPNRRGVWRCLALAAAVAVGLGAPRDTWAAQPDRAPRLQKRWVYVSDNLYVNDNVPKLEALLRRAARASYNGVLFADYKTFTWWQLSDAKRWEANAARLRNTATDLNLELVVAVFPFGYSGSLLWHDVNLAAGMPIRNAPLVAGNGRLVPEQTAVIKNGSFEEHTGSRASAFRFQDDPGRGSFIDSRFATDGKVSLRFENVGKVNRHGHGRVCQEIAVAPWQQYRIRAWMKTENLTASQIQLLVLAGGRTLQYQHPVAGDGKRRRYLRRASDLTTDWVEQSVTFNSLDNTKVLVYAGIWGGKTGRIWWDDLRIDAVPTLNVLRRDALPLAVVGEGGTAYQEGRDFQPVVDPGLGRTNPWPGAYDTHHEPPAVELTAGSRIRNGQRVRLSCHHATIVYAGQVSCSMSDPKVFDLCAEQMRMTRKALAPDGYFMSHDEIRCAGWEPQQQGTFGTSGELFAYNVDRCLRIARGEGTGRPLYVWSDMYDPHHNAHADYYLVNNTLEGSWEGLDKDVVVMKWGGGWRARPGLEFFAKRGHRQMIAAYYDGNVEENHRMWTVAAGGVPGVIGVMYTTWRNDYSQLERFAELWWGGGG